MATGTPLSGRKFLVKLGDGATPEVFSAPCGLVTKGINLSKATSESVLPDCDDVDVVPWVKREPGSRSGTVTGAGKIARAHLADWRAFFENDDAQNVQYHVPGTGAQGGGYWQGAFHCTALNISAVHGEHADIDVEMVTDGDLTWTAAA